MGTCFFPGLKRPWRGANPPLPSSMKRLKEGIAIILPISRSLAACKWRTFTFTDGEEETAWHLAANYVN
jgi:hypothetical protein